MYRVRTCNKISSQGLDLLSNVAFQVSDSEKDAHAILLRSYKLHGEVLPDSLLAIGRAGVGVNNIPVSQCSKQGVVVFNSPGANANAVKELVLTGLLMSSRKVIEGIDFVRSLNGKEDQIPELVESHKSDFKGAEVMGKSLGIIGLGAIGVMVSNSAIDLGMNVFGHDPFITVNSAWGLSRSVVKAENMKRMLGNMDYVSVHVPLTDNTTAFINKECLSSFKPGAVLINFSRSEIVVEKDVIEALSSGQLSLYVSDFPTQALLKNERTVCIPHLGASTVEAEDNCAIMVSKQIRDYLLHGNICNSVNFPNCSMERMGKYRLTIANDNIPNMVGQITSVLASDGCNILEMMNKSCGEIAYNILDTEIEVEDDTLRKLKDIEGVFLVRQVIDS